MLANARATSCVGVSPHLRYLRFFLMGLELWKHIVILFRNKAQIRTVFPKPFSRTTHHPIT